MFLFETFFALFDMYVKLFEFICVKTDELYEYVPLWTPLVSILVFALFTGPITVSTKMYSTQLGKWWILAVSNDFLLNIVLTAYMSIRWYSTIYIYFIYMTSIYIKLMTLTPVSNKIALFIVFCNIIVLYAFDVSIRTNYLFSFFIALVAIGDDTYFFEKDDDLQQTIKNGVIEGNVN